MVLKISWTTWSDRVNPSQDDGYILPHLNAHFQVVAARGGGLVEVTWFPAAHDRVCSRGVARAHEALARGAVERDIVGARRLRLEDMQRPVGEEG